MLDNAAVNDDIIENLSDELDDVYSNDDLYNINSWGADLSFRELITMYDEDELLKPELQRNYVWDKVEASRFIDSLLLGLPVPSVFLANTPDSNKLIIDGYQRIMTVYDYVKGIWSKDNKIFRLSNSSKINNQWRNKAFSELTPTEQKKIRSTTIHAIIFEQNSPSDDDTSLYQIFERINTGGRSLMAQEIRNCVYQGNLNSCLMHLNNNPNWRALFGTPSPDPRMRDMEFILRGLALDTDRVREHESGNISLKKLLNEFMGNRDNNTEDSVKKFSTRFTETISFIYTHIGQDAFFNVIQSAPHKIRRRFYPTVFDAVFVATAIALRENGKNGYVIPTANLESKRFNLLLNTKFKNHVTAGTMQIDNIHGRISMVLEGLYGLQYQ
ncbi:TPA: DUF262 domain-containing protein [Serratia marcescens]